MPPYGAINPYYQNTNTYGSPWGLDFPSAPIADMYLNVTNPNAAYTRMTSGYGGGYDPFSRFVQQEQGRAKSGYEAAAATHPNLKWTDYLTELGGQAGFQQRFRQQTPSQRGESWGQNAPRARWQTWG